LVTSAIPATAATVMPKVRLARKTPAAPRAKTVTDDTAESDQTPAAAAQPSQEELLKELIAALERENGARRVAATKAIFELGEKALEPLKEAGAKQISPFGTIDTRRIDMVYSLLEGLRPSKPNAMAGYTQSGFGLRVDEGCTRDDVEAMGKKFGFTIEGQFTAGAAPTCYVMLKEGKKLEEVLKAVLSEETKVRSANLNYYER